MSTYQELIDSGKLITAYTSNLPTEAFEQDGPGLDKTMKVPAEHTKLEHWDDAGKPYLKEYQGSGKLEGKIALLTGADSGIGRSAAIMFAREGASVSIVALEAERRDAEDVKKEIETSSYSKGAKCSLIFADLSINGEGEAKRIIEEHKAVYGERLDGASPSHNLHAPFVADHHFFLPQCWSTMRLSKSCARTSARSTSPRWKGRTRSVSLSHDLAQRTSLT